MPYPYQENPPLQNYLEQLHASLSPISDGKVADYIPELSHADPDWFGIALVTVDGHVYQVGDTRQPFTMQSISKAIVYGLALSDKGVDFVTSKVGVEPSGDAFNSISLYPESGMPFNPMINAGAIATTGMIKSKDNLTPIQRILKTMEMFVAHRLEINEAVYRSESETGHRNRAISHLLRNFDIMEQDFEESVETYFKQCSINMTCRDIALMAATLANNGVNPITGVAALEDKYVHKVLSVMGSCGMYDYSGNWLYRVGMPAKSGVGGGIMAVLPGQFGLGVFSPALDPLGNSVRGVKVCEKISTEFGLHLFRSAQSTSASVVRVEFTGDKIHSRKTRRDDELAVLSELGRKIYACELQGDLMFGSTDSIIRVLLNKKAESKYFIIDLSRIVAIDHASERLWIEAAKTFNEMGISLLFTGTHNKYKFLQYLKKQLSRDLYESITQFSERDYALEWCEEQLLSELNSSPIVSQLYSFNQQTLCQGFSEKQIEQLMSICKPVNFRKGDEIIKRNEKAESMFFILQGHVEVYLTMENHKEKRLTTLATGMSFGELAMLNNRKRSASIRALEDTQCFELKFNDIEPEIKALMLANIATMLVEKVERDSREIEILY